MYITKFELKATLLKIFIIRDEGFDAVHLTYRQITLQKNRSNVRISNI